MQIDSSLFEIARLYQTVTTAEIYTVSYASTFTSVLRNTWTKPKIIVSKMVG